jgi:anthranilate 1,2-dioxygenase small subunit
MMDSAENMTGQFDDGLQRRVDLLQLRYVHSIDDGPLDGWPDFFTDECLYTIIARDNVERGQDLGVMRFESAAMLRDRATATQHAAVFAPRTIRHILNPTLIDRVDKDGIHARTNVAIYQTSPDGDTNLLVAGQYRDWIVDIDGMLKFREKRVVYDTFRLPDSVVYPF